ncbi:MAG: hypothetical protein Q9175_003622 [Cornicularia normoerica]
MEATPLASLSLTHVHYVRTLFRFLIPSYPTSFSPLTSALQNPHDPISFLCAWLALTPQTLCVIYVTLIWSTREVEILLMFAGQMGCEALNFLLKRLIKGERPKRTSNAYTLIARALLEHFL